LSLEPDSLSDEKPEALLKSALEKILYFEARSSQLTNDADTSRSELERFKNDLAAASQREIELRRVVAELEVRVTRAHSEREETARLADALRRERADLVGKMLEASRIHGLEQGFDDFDLSQFIAQLRSEVLVSRGGTAPVLVGAAPTSSDTVTGVANELKAQGRLTVSANDFAALTGAREFPGRSEETLFGFSVRELSAPDTQARVRAAERLQALRHPAAAPALATALHGETEPSVQVALLGALASLAKAEALPVVMPLLSNAAPEVRIAALKAMITLDAPAAAPHLAAATKDPDKAVRRRASLLALGLSGKEALELGTQAIRDTDADVRSLAALVLGASNAEVARPLLLEAMRDVDLRVRRAASQSLSRLLGQDVTSLVSLDDAHRRREVRRISSIPSKPITSLSPPGERVGERGVAQFSASQQRTPVAAVAAAPRAPVAAAPRAPVAAPQRAPVATATATAPKSRVAVLETIEVQAATSPALFTSAMRELRASIRGRQLTELAEGIGASTEETMKVCGELIAQGQVVRRGLKYFVA
jgi:HEAT repeat protein